MAALTVGEQHLQPMGLVHGGVYSSMAETVCSIGASLNVRVRDPEAMCVGLENHTTFLRASRIGAELVVEAVPLHAGRRTQSWSAVIRDRATGREAAIANVRLIVVRPGEV